MVYNLDKVCQLQLAFLTTSELLVEVSSGSGVTQEKTTIIGKNYYKRAEGIQKGHTGLENLGTYLQL